MHTHVSGLAPFVRSRANVLPADGALGAIGDGLPTAKDDRDVVRDLELAERIKQVPFRLLQRPEPRHIDLEFVRNVALVDLRTRTFNGCKRFGHKIGRLTGGVKMTFW